MKNSNYQEFREKLESAHQWPSLYMFKFIVPKDSVDEVKALFPKNTVAEKESKTGKYVSVTIQIMASSTDQVIDLYTEANKIEDLIAL